MDEVLNVFLAILITAVAVAFIAYDKGRDAVARDCKTLSAFAHNGKAYECKIQKG